MKFRVPLPVYYKIYKTLGSGRGKYYALRLVKLLRLRDLLVRMDPIWACNLRCAMCYFSKNRERGHDTKAMAVPFFEKIANDIFPRTRLLFFGCGAEPLMSRDFTRYAAIIGRHNIPFVSLLTNGQLLNREIVGSLLENRFNELTISVDGATKPTYEGIRSGASFERLLENLHLADAMKGRTGKRGLLNLRFTFIAMKRNIDELTPLVDLAARYRVSSIRVRSLGTWDGALDYAGETLPPPVYLESCRRARESAQRQRISFLYEGMYDHRPASEGNRTLHTRYACVDPFYKLIIRNDGKMRYCPELPWEHGDFARQSYREMERSDVLKIARQRLAGCPEQSCLTVCQGKFPGI
jgi:MoaA/NifB/PqqE/SkfB family radical SAM enzyme